jgi:predicted phosphodiesterase
MVLHGHLHESTEYTRKGIRFSNSGGSIKAAKKNIISINFIDISEKGITTEINSIKEFPQRIPEVSQKEIELNKFEITPVLSEAVVC